MIELSKIRIDGGTQARAELNQETVAEYAEAYKAGVAMPPVTVFYDGATHWLADGFHRYFGAKQAGKETIYEEVTPGSQRDAVLFSLGANAKHGLRRSNADKRRSVDTMLADAEWAAWSQEKVAGACGVSSGFVSKMVHEFASLHGEEIKPATRTVERNGKTYEQNTANIGTKPDKAVPAKVEGAKPEAVDGQCERADEPEEPPFDPDEYELSELHETVRVLANENDALKDRIAVGQMDASDEDRDSALDTLAELRKQINNLEIEVEAIRNSRDSFQRENAVLKQQCSMQRKQIAKLQEVPA